MPNPAIQPLDDSQLDQVSGGVLIIPPDTDSGDAPNVGGGSEPPPPPPVAGPFQPPGTLIPDIA
jgi:hypothetical protein